MPSCPNCKSWLKPGLSHENSTFVCDSCGVTLCEDEDGANLRKLRFVLALLIFPFIALFVGFGNIVFYAIALPIVFLSYLGVSKYKTVDDGLKWGSDKHIDI